MDEFKNLLVSMDENDFDSMGHQMAMGNFVTNIYNAIEDGNADLAKHFLEKLIICTDGVALRGKLDEAGPESDWIMNEDLQVQSYELLNEAYLILS